MFNSVLIANRGEIACRITATAKAMGLRTIAVYSTADENALHVKTADEAYWIGAAEAASSYLDGNRILDVAKKAGAGCIHPGYGFLSENAEFAEACTQAGITFIGPTASAMRAMGLKDKAKALMEQVGVPVVPGVHGSDQSAGELGHEAERIGYPILIKAVAGGGGKGMRKVEKPEDFASELAACQREAINAFGNDMVLLEKFIENPRHIEIQIFGDSFGNYVYLFERDCSLQRRHQKVIEEAPAPGMTDGLRVRMGQAAIKAARAVDYSGAGTVEFIVPGAQSLKDETPFYFMEMNTRLQVEHPVTEMITGLDLVEWQLRVAAGEPLPKQQSELSISGHSIEVRLYAEDPSNDFLPSPGKIRALKWPELANDHLRIETGIEAGGEVSRFYDPMIAKLIVKADSRACAIDHMAQALKQTAVLGIKTNIGFLINLVSHDGFRHGGVNTGFIDAHMEALTSSKDMPRLHALVIAAYLIQQKLRSSSSDISNDLYSPFLQTTGWQLGGPRTSALDVRVEGQRRAVQIAMPSRDACDITLGEQCFSITDMTCKTPLESSACLDGDTISFSMVSAEDGLLVYIGGYQLNVHACDFSADEDAAGAGGAIIRAPMTGKLQRLFVARGDVVSKGNRLAVLEAMKMEHPLVAGISGVVKQVQAGEGEQVSDGDILIVLEAENIES